MENLEEKWLQVVNRLKGKFDNELDVKSILFILGLRELGKVGSDFSKEEKMDLMNIGFCRIASLSGYFRTDGNDDEGWPLWKQAKPIPKMSTKEQEVFIKEHVVKYFETEKLI